MIFNATFKTPDVLDNELERFNDIDKEIAKNLADKFISYGEYITIEFDTVNQTAVVVRQKR